MTAGVLRRRPARSPFAVQRGVLHALLVRELKTRFGGRWLGVYWAVLDPLAQVLVLALLLGTLHRAVLPGLDYPAFLLTGIVPFYLFRNLAVRGMDGIDANRALFGYRQVRPLDTLIARTAIETWLYALVSAISLVLFATLGRPWQPGRPLEILGLGVVVVAGGFGLGLLLAVATDPLPQLRGFVRLLFMPLYFLSGVITPITVAPVDWWPVLMLNPLLHVVEVSRGLFFADYRVVDGLGVGYPALCALVVLVAGLAAYRVRRQQILAN